MKNLFLLLILLKAGFALAQQPLEKVPLSLGEQVKFSSAILQEERLLNIYLPYGYSRDSLQTYPVIYLLDGGMDEDFLHISGLVQFGSFSWIKMLPESIVVGIVNTDRRRDFTFPTRNLKDKEDFPTTGGSAAFIKFLEEEVQPLVNREYHTSEETTLIGQSLGGLLATEILFEKPDMFDNYIIVSPSLWWDDQSMLSRTPAAPAAPKNLFIAVGKEGEIMEETARQLYELLNDQWAEKHQIYFDFLEEQDHGDALHLAVYHALEKIFGREED